MSLDMRLPLVHNALAIFLAISLIAISTAVLSLVSYHYTVGRENLVETTLVQSNIKIAAQSVDGIEQEIISNDHILSDMVDADNQKKWPAMAEAIKKADLNVEQVYFLQPNNDYPRYPPYSYDIRNQWGAFRSSFKMKELNLDDMVINQMHHLHKERPNNYFFASYVLKEDRKGKRVLVVYQMNFDRIVALLDRHLSDLQLNFYVSIVDYENNIVYGQPISRSSKYFFETRFPTTLYKWILQIVPRKYLELERDVSNKRRTNLFFIVLSIFLTVVSLAIIYMGWRRDRQLRQLKESFISNVSHELKTPLSLIRMFSEILVTDRVKNESRRLEYYRIIHNESDRMSRLINNLLDFATLEQEAGRRHFETVNIGRLISEALEAYRYELEKDGFQLDLDVAPDIADSYADPTAITMAFINLLDNSIKYSGDQKLIRVRIIQNNGFVELSVADKGLGIPASEHQKIFEKFYRGNDASVHRIRGSGIGLSITKNVAEMHGGEVLLESEPGKGSVFILRIPIQKEAGKDIRDSKSDRETPSDD